MFVKISVLFTLSCTYVAGHHPEHHTRFVTSSLSHSLPGKSSITIHRTHAVPHHRPLAHNHKAHAVPNHVPSAHNHKAHTVPNHVPSVPNHGPSVHNHVPSTQKSQRNGKAISNRGGVRPFVPSVKDEPKYSPFNPRFPVTREEVSDYEWQTELKDAFTESGLYPSVLKSIPGNLINVNFGLHNCVHMGTDLRPDSSAYPPTDLSYPTTKHPDGSVDLFTLVALNVDDNLSLQWLVVNIRGTKVDTGKVVTEYRPPTPGPNRGSQRYLLLIFRQNKYLEDNSELFDKYAAGVCQTNKREGVSLQALADEFSLQAQPFAANYFKVRYSPFVDSIYQYCDGPNPTRAF